MKKIEYHPAAEIYRLMDSEERQPMRDSIKQHGQQEPIAVYKDKILDGRNRFLCCTELKVDPWLVHLSDKELDGLSPVEYVVIKNAHRRHDDLAERQLAAGRMVIALQHESAERQTKNLKKGRETPEGTILGRRGKARDIAAAATGVSPNIADASAKLQKSGAAAVIQAVEDRELSLSDAASIAELPKAEQKKALAKVESGKAKTLREAAAPKTPAVDKSRPSGKQTKDPRAWESWESLFGQLKRATDKINNSGFTHSIHCRAVQQHLNNAESVVRQWRKDVR